MTLENEYQNKLDRIARVNTEFYECQNCQEEFDEFSMCEHDDTIHRMCQECCDAFHEEEYKEQFGKEDLD